MTKNWKKYIFWFAQEHVEFRFAEIQSLIKLFNISIKFDFNIQEIDSRKPFWIVELPNEESAKKIASRSISLRCILELWSHSNCIDQMHENLRDFLAKKRDCIKRYFEPDCTFKITVETYNKRFSQTEKVEKIEKFDYLPITGRVNLKNPKIQWLYIEYYGLNPCDVTAQPFDILFGRWIMDGQRQLIKELSLKTRKFIGNTSMDAQLSLLMANQALVKSGDFVLDPFVGTGSLLVSAAKFGGFVLGTDINYMMIHAKAKPTRITQKIREKDESIKSNLKQYNCDQRYLDVLVSDFSTQIWRDNITFDSIITDPPYGIREAMEKIETKISKKENTRDEDNPHYPSTSPYSLKNIYADLMNFSAKHLKLKGRLVCWFPYHNDDYSKGILPTHKNFKLIANSEQLLCGLTSRRLLTYEKINDDVNNDDSNHINIYDFRERYFDSSEETRQERRMQKAEIREISRLEALKRGKRLDENGKIISYKSNSSNNDDNTI